jgi:hypothetical protein
MWSLTQRRCGLGLPKENNLFHQSTRCRAIRQKKAGRARSKQLGYNTDFARRPTDLVGDVFDIWDLGLGLSKKSIHNDYAKTQVLHYEGLLFDHSEHDV